MAAALLPLALPPKKVFQALAPRCFLSVLLEPVAVATAVARAVAAVRAGLVFAWRRWFVVRSAVVGIVCSQSDGGGAKNGLYP